MEQIKQALTANKLTQGILNKFIKLASEEECSDKDFYNKSLLRVLNFRQDLLLKDIRIPELEKALNLEDKKEDTPKTKRKYQKKVKNDKWF